MNPSAAFTVNSSMGAALTQMLQADQIEPGTAPSYELCKTIYTFHPLGMKMAEAPVAMAQFLPREISVPDSPEDMVRDAFLKEWQAIHADEVIYNVAALSRVYGAASQACLTEGTPVADALDFKTLAGRDIAFNVFDPLNTAGSLVLNQTANAIDFLKSTNIAVCGDQYHRSRTVVLMNERPVFLSYTASAFGYVGRSVYQRALYPMKSFIQTMLTDDLVTVKAGVLIAKMQQPGSIIDNLMGAIAGIKRAFVQVATTGNVISVGPQDAIESLNLQNLDGAYGMARKNILENIAVSADMPAKLLNAETFAEGFGEGTEDAKNVARYVDRVRTWMAPLYEFFDKVVMYRAWNEEFFRTVQQRFPDSYRGKTYAQVFWEWRNSFAAQWPSLLTEPESEQIETDKAVLEAVISAFEVLAPQLDPENRTLLVMWLADQYNSRKKLFSSPLSLDQESLEKWMSERQEATIEEPSEPRPATLNDSTASLRRMVRDAAGMSLKGSRAALETRVEVGKLLRHLHQPGRA